MEDEIKKEKQIKAGTIIYAVIILLLAYIIVVGILIYGLGSDGRIAQKTANVIPYPAAVVNETSFVSFSELKKDLNSIKMFYENQDFSESGMRVDFATENGKKRLMIKEKNLLNKLIENKIVEKLARERGIAISPKEVSETVERKMGEYGNQETVKENLKRLYGWNLNDFEERIVRPDLYREALEKNVRENEPQSLDARKKIEKVSEALKNKEDFAKVAEKYSDGESGRNGGELGWLSLDQMIPEISAAVIMMNKGERSDIIESALGYHIIELEDKKTEEGLAKFKLKQIFTATKGFPDWLLAQEKNIRIFIPLKEFFWSKKTQEVEFTSPELKEFEANLEKNSPGDISILF